MYSFFGIEKIYTEISLLGINLKCKYVYLRAYSQLKRIQVLTKNFAKHFCEAF